MPEKSTLGDMAYSPFGETYAQWGSKVDFSFTGMNQDVDQSWNPAGLYDFPAREYGIQRRWPTPDSAGLAAVNPTNPQSWNHYSYVGNNPLAGTDPSGYFLPVIINPVDGGPCIPYIIGIGIFGIFSLIFGFGSPPEAPPAPPGGYGTRIEPYGTWDEKLPAGSKLVRPLSMVSTCLPVPIVKGGETPT